MAIDITVNEPAAEWVPIEALKPWPNNPRKIAKHAVDKVASSIERFGFGAPIVARRADGEIVAGHVRLAAAKKLGLEMVPTRFVDLSAEDAHALAIGDNRLVAEVPWDDDLLATVLADLKTDGLDLAITGFDSSEIDRLLSAAAGERAGDAPEAELERADELQAKWKTARGQRWRIPSRSVAGGEHVIVCGDSTVADDVTRAMGDERADCLWSDPPFGVEYEGKRKKRAAIANDDLSSADLRTFLASAFTAATEHALKEGAAVYIAHPPGPLTVEFLLAAREAHWRVRQGLVWVKDSFVVGHSDYHLAHELVFLAYAPGGGRRGRGHEGWCGDNAQGSVFQVSRPKKSESHATTKPVELIAPMIRNSCPVRGIVYEPFAGSGSTMVACETTQRLCRAIELEARYIACTLERMAAMGLEPVLDS